jgi:hypothetical protein
LARGARCVHSRSERARARRHVHQRRIAEHRGWGHSTYDEALDLAIDSDVETLVLFHHKPERSDDDLDAWRAACRDAARARGSRLRIVAAAEGMSLDVNRRDVAREASHSPHAICAAGRQRRHDHARDTIDERTHRLVRAARHDSRRSASGGFVDLVPAFVSIVVHYDPSAAARRGDATPHEAW